MKRFLSPPVIRHWMNFISWLWQRRNDVDGWNWECVYAWISCLAKVKLDFASACFNFGSGKARIKKCRNSVSLPFSTQVSTQSLTVDSSETYFCGGKKSALSSARYIQTQHYQWNLNVYEQEVWRDVGNYGTLGIWEPFLLIKSQHCKCQSWKELTISWSQIPSALLNSSSP